MSKHLLLSTNFYLKMQTFAQKNPQFWKKWIFFRTHNLLLLSVEILSKICGVCRNILFCCPACFFNPRHDPGVYKRWNYLWWQDAGLQRWMMIQWCVLDGCAVHQPCIRRFRRSTRLQTLPATSLCQQSPGRDRSTPLYVLSRPSGCVDIVLSPAATVASALTCSKEADSEIVVGTAIPTGTQIPSY